MHRVTDGNPAYSERRATAGWRLHDESARKMRMASNTAPSAPTPAFACMDSRTPSREVWKPCEPYHQRKACVNGSERPRSLFGIGGVRGSPVIWNWGGERLRSEE